MNEGEKRAREVAERLKTGSPYSITNRERMRIWIEEALTQAEQRGEARERALTIERLKLRATIVKNIEGTLSYAVAVSELLRFAKFLRSRSSKKKGDGR